LLQDGVEHVHQLDMRNRLEGGYFGRGQRTKFRAADKVSIYVRHELGVLHG